MSPSVFLKSLIDDPPFWIASFKTFLEFLIIFSHSDLVKFLADFRGLIFEKYKISLA